MKRINIRLNEQDHVRHPLDFAAATVARFLEDGERHTARAGVTDEEPLVITCMKCNVRLMEGEDYEVEEVEAWQG